jgi:16S rRNA (uracil1498-N3)-methyltransferase
MPRTHAALPRLFVEQALAEGEAVSLGKEQSLYLAAVLRKIAGDEVVLFNGFDGAWLGRIDAAAKRSVYIELVEQIAPQPPRGDLWHGFAPLKAARLDYLVQKATEMGVSTLQPVVTRFTQVTRIPLDRIRANAIEAAEQCEVLNVPEIAAEVTLPRLLEGWLLAQGERLLVMADEAAPPASPIGQLAALAGRPIGLLVGPEGGFALEERQLLLAQAFVIPISLGPRVLRADTAAVAALAVIQSIIGDWR